MSVIHVKVLFAISNENEQKYDLPNIPLSAPTIPKTMQAVLTLQQQHFCSVILLKFMFAGHLKVCCVHSPPR